MFPTQYSRYTVLRLLDTVENGSKFWHIKSILIVGVTSIIHYLLFPVFMIYQLVAERFIINKWINQKKIFDDKNPKVCIYSPWFDKYGGGAEAVAAYIAQYFERYQANSSVTILCDDYLRNIIISPANLQEINNKYGTSLQKTSIIFKRHGFYSLFMYGYYLRFLKTSMDYDIFINCFINVTPTNAHRNIHYLHFPFTKKEAISPFMFDLYTTCNHLFIANSDYTYGWALKFLNPEKMITIEPPVHIRKNVSLLAKQKVILSAGRISIEKNLGILIEAFKEFSKETGGWQYFIVGSKNPNNEKYYNQLKKQAEGYPVVFYTNKSKDEYNELLSKGTVFWHAMGYGTDFKETPQNAEHFGITTIEAMAHGCIPLVFDVGGPADVVRKHGCGYVWNNIDELRACTKKLSEEPQTIANLSKIAIEKAQLYDEKYFYKGLDKMMLEIFENG
jgi:glycosyltransferase involved in cell wall biosynthesis